MIHFDGGIHVGEKIILDPIRKKERAFISHAHSDHLRRHETILATAETIALARVNHRQFNGIPLEWGRTYKFDTGNIRVEPAGHILGSSQFIIDYGQKRIVYTGDFKLGPNAICGQAQIHECDILVMDSTFGRPEFVFPDYRELISRLLEFVDSCLHRGTVPIIYAYALGKAQEVMKILGDNGFEIYVTKSIAQYADIYRSLGVKMPEYRIFDGGFPENGALIVPPFGAQRDDLLAGYAKKRCLVSGWAISPRYYNRRFFDKAIPLSDHASFNSLLEYAELSRAKVIHCLFGFAEIVEALKYRGMNAIKASLKEAISAKLENH